MEILEESEEVLIVTKHGYGKRTPAEEYRIQTRGGVGIKTCNVTEKNGELIALKTVSGEEDLMLITAAGVLIRMAVEDISKTGRNTQGVKLIRLEASENEYVSTVAMIEREEEKDLIEDISEVETVLPVESTETDSNPEDNDTNQSMDEEEE